MNFLEKIRDLPLAKRKVILWVIVIVIGIVLMSWWLKGLFQKLENPELLYPEIPPINFEKTFENIPEIKISPELLEEMEKMSSEENIILEGGNDEEEEEEQLKKNN